MCVYMCVYACACVGCTLRGLYLIFLTCMPLCVVYSNAMCVRMCEATKQDTVLKIVLGPWVCHALK